MRFPLFMMVGTVLLFSSACSDSVTVHNPPVLDLLGPIIADENSNVAFTLTATDADGDTLAFSAAELPAGAALDPSTGEFLWTPGYSDAGSYEISFTVSDGGLDDSETVTVTVNNVNRAPVLELIGPKTVAENSTLFITPAATDPDGDSLVYSVGLQSGASFDPSTPEYSWTPGFSDAGRNDITFTVSDGTLEDSETVNITIENVNRAPVLAFIGSKTVDENSTLAFTIGATDIDGDFRTYSATGLPSGAAFNPSTREFNWTPGYSDAGVYEATFTASDGDLEDSETVTITVNDLKGAPVLDPIGPKAVGENSLLSFTLTATDPDGDVLTYSAIGLPPGAALDPSTGLFLWTPGFSDIGSYEVVFTVSDGSLRDSETVTITVGDVNFAPVLDPIGQKAVDEGSTLSFTLTATDYDGDPLTFAAAGLPAGASLDTITGEFAWTPGYSDAGSYVIAFTVSDGNLDDSETVTVTVNNGNLPPVLDPIGSKAVDENTTLALTLTATDADGDALVYGAAGLPPGASLDASTGEFSWTLGSSDGAIYQVTFTVSDGTLEDSETVTISTPYAYPVSPDGFEPDNSAQNSGFMEVGQPQFHSIFPVGEEDWVRVSLTGGVKYEFTASHLSVNGDTWLYLYDTDGESLLISDDDWVGYDSAFQYTPAVGGVYYLRVNGYNIQGLTSYKLDVHPFVDNDGDGWSIFHDCDDGDPGINPKAEDIAGDGIDQNCTGTDALVADAPDAFEDDGTAETATAMVVARGMQYEFIRRGEFFPGAVHTLNDVNDEDWFTVEILPHQSVAAEVISGYNRWPFIDSSFGEVSLDVADTGLRTWSVSRTYVFVANDSDKPKTAFIRAAGYEYGPPPSSYLIYAVPQGFDNDQDGYGTMGMWFEHDCDDANPWINDGGFEIPGDGIDQDCNGVDAPAESAAPVRQAPLKKRR